MFDESPHIERSAAIQFRLGPARRAVFRAGLTGWSAAHRIDRFDNRRDEGLERWPAVAQPGLTGPTAESTGPGDTQVGSGRRIDRVHSGAGGH